MYPLLDIINTLLETAVLASILLDIRLYFNREKKQETRDEEYLKLQQQVVLLLTQQKDATEELIEEVIEIQPQEVISDEFNSDRDELNREASEVKSSSASTDAFTDPRGFGIREELVSKATS